MDNQQTSFPYVLFKLTQNVYGINLSFIKSFEILECVSELPGSPSHFRGVVNLRGEIIPLLDLRAFLGLRSMRQELDDMQAMLEKRKSDHVRWVEELERSVEENREFRLTTDPHACAFGKWYDSYHTEDNRMQYLLNKFAKPHERIHAIGAKVKESQSKGEFEKARQLIQSTKDSELQLMIHLFSEFVNEYRDGVREIVMVAAQENGKYPGFVVDEIISIEYLKEYTSTSDRASDNSWHYVICRRQNDDTPVITLNPQWLQAQFNL